MTRLALIGCGNDTPHCISASRRLVGARVVAVVDADVGRASHVARHIDAPLVKTSLEHLLVDHGDDCEAVVIQADWAEHATLTVEAALGGKHVLVDSPLALTVESADTAIAACAAAGVRLMVGQSLRFAPASLVAPYKYTAIVWALLLGYLFWGESPTPIVWLGTALIIASGVAILYDQRDAKR